MSMLDALLAAFCLLTLGLHLITTAMAMRRCRPPQSSEPVIAGSPAVTILRPVCGVDTYDHLTLRSTFELDYQDARLIFCCDKAHDPAARLVRSLMAEFPHTDARLLIGCDPLTSNPKLNNLLKGWPRVDTDWLILADSNVLMPKDYVQRLLSGWGPRTGILCAPPIGYLPAGFWGELECAFLNTYQARWQYAADSAGFGFAQGKTMTFRRRDLAAAGGLVALGAEVAEDAAATKVVRGLGLRAQLVDAPFKQPLGPRTARQVWDRQARWSRLRRMTFPAFFLPEILTTSLLPMAAAAYLADALDLPALAGAAAFAILWYGAEIRLAARAGWHLSWLSPLAYIARDAVLPVLWAQGWLLDSFSWRGNEISADSPASQTA
jgi:ceramide glucosyltransferase